MEQSITEGPAFFIISGVWAALMIGMFISATRLCYAIEARSGRPVLKHGVPGYANVFPVAFNVGVAKDEETQRMRWRMNQRLLVILAGFVVFILYVNAADAG